LLRQTAPVVTAGVGNCSVARKNGGGNETFSSWTCCALEAEDATAAADGTYSMPLAIALANACPEPFKTRDRKQSRGPVAATLKDEATLLAANTDDISAESAITEASPIENPCDTGAPMHPSATFMRTERGVLDQDPVGTCKRSEGSRSELWLCTTARAKDPDDSPDGSNAAFKRSGSTA